MAEVAVAQTMADSSDLRMPEAEKSVKRQLVEGRTPPHSGGPQRGRLYLSELRVKCCTLGLSAADLCVLDSFIEGGDITQFAQIMTSIIPPRRPERAWAFDSSHTKLCPLAKAA